MHFTNLAKIFLLSTSLALQASAGPSHPKVTAGNFPLVQTSAAGTGPSRLLASAGPPFVPTEANLIVNITVPVGEPSLVGWVFDSVEDNSAPVFDGFTINVTVFFTPPGGEEEFLLGIESGPEIGPGGFCGFLPGFGVVAVLDEEDIGTYTGRWTVEFGQSTHPYAPVDPDTGCGPEPFNSRTVEFVKTWEVVEAEA
ncbi:hypothetical protein FB451DRAFT_1273928 [Mycena latifolia]|nr:hypothetical protein FB451DRAFT_1273928 [Mycena latifolia]